MATFVYSSPPQRINGAWKALVTRILRLNAARLIAQCVTKNSNTPVLRDTSIFGILDIGRMLAPKKFNTQCVNVALRQRHGGAISDGPSAGRFLFSFRIKNVVIGHARQFTNGRRGTAPLLSAICGGFGSSPLENPVVNLSSFGIK